jgi:PAS domain S-box-containing protein
MIMRSAPKRKIPQGSAEDGAETTLSRTFDTSLAIGLFLVVALLAGSIAIAYRNIQRLHGHSENVARTHAVLDAIDVLISTVKDAETGERGFVITGDRTYLEPYNNAVAAVDEEIRDLRIAVEHDARQRRDFLALQRLIAAKRDELQRGIDARSERGFKAARDIVRTDQGKRTMDAIREVATEMRQTERERLQRRAEAAESSYWTAVATEVLAGVLGLGMVCAFTYLLRRHLLVRAKAAAALSEEKERFVTTLASVGDAVIATDTAARTNFLNPMAESLTGWTQQAAAGKPLDQVFRIVDERTRTPVENPALRSLREGVVVNLADDTLLIAKDGAERPIDDSAAPIRDRRRGLIGAVLVFRDVTERKHAQDALRLLAESGTILSSSLDYDATLKNVARLAVNALSDYCFFDLLHDGEIKRVAWAHKDPEKELGMSAIGRFVPDKRNDRFPVAKTLASGKTEFVPRVDEAWLRAVSSSPEHYQHMRAMDCYSWMTVPVMVKGRTLGALTFCRSGTGERYFTDADRELAEELGRRAGLAVQNALLHQELERSAEELRQADRRKDEFLAVLAHELRNPLAPLRNGLKIIQMARKEGYTAARAREMMERQLQQMVRLIDDLMDISRVTENRLALRRETVDLAAVIKSAEEISRPAIEKSGQTLAVSLPPEPIYLYADPMRLAQVFSNLLNNSAKHSGRGAHIALSAAREDADVLIKVKDDGIGIPPEMLTRVFEPFTQVNGSLERAGGGLGIGLTLVQQLVRMHDGSVEARSEGRGKGSEFVVRLQVEAAPSKPRVAPADDTETPRAARSLRVLVADDNEDAANSLGALLRMMGHDARVAYDGEEAIELAELFRPEVLLLDIGMPKMNGHDVAREVRGRPWGGNATLIALTGYGQAEDKRRTRDAGFDHHIVKPADINALERLIATL